MALDGTSTITDALSQLNSNLLWFKSTAKAEAFVEAANWLLINRAQASAAQGFQMSFADLQDQVDRAIDFLTIGAGSSTSRTSFTTGRPV